MRRPCLLVVALAGLPAATAFAQRVEVAATLGYVLPVKDQLSRAVIIEDRGIPVWGRYTGRQQAALVPGLQAAVWVSPRIGIEMLANVYSTSRIVDQAPPYFFASTRADATVVNAATRLAMVVQRTAGREIRVAFGPQVSFFSGTAYTSPPRPELALSSRSVWGASAGIAMQYPLNRRVSVRAALDAAVYRVRLTPLTVPDSTSAPLQLDLMPGLAVVIHTH